MNKEIKTLNQIKSPSEVINIALAETLQGWLIMADPNKYCTLTRALYYAALPDGTSCQMEELVKGFGAGATEFPGGIGYGIYGPNDWSPEIDYYLDGGTYSGYQVNKAFFLMMMEEWFAANPEEDSWESVAKWKMEMAEKQKLVENETEIKEMKND